MQRHSASSESVALRFTFLVQHSLKSYQLEDPQPCSRLPVSLREHKRQRCTTPTHTHSYQTQCCEGWERSPDLLQEEEIIIMIQEKTVEMYDWGWQSVLIYLVCTSVWGWFGSASSCCCKNLHLNKRVWCHFLFGSSEEMRESCPDWWHYP